MEIRYHEWLPAAVGLKGIVTAYWGVAGDGTQVPSSAILPDGHVELVFNLGDPVGLSGPAFTGDQPAAVVVGPLTRAVSLRYRGHVNTFGIRFHPARGPAFFGQPAASLTDRLVPLSGISSFLDGAVSPLLSSGWNADSDRCRDRLDEVLLEQLASSPPADMVIAAAVDRLSDLDSLPSIAEIAEELGLSARQLQRRFLSSVGVAPKQFVRILRFSRLWQAASMQPPDTWAELAAEHGYADQAHMVREFRDFGAEPPTRFFTEGWYDTTELSRLSGPAEGVRSGQNVRSVQDSNRKGRL